ARRGTAGKNLALEIRPGVSRRGGAHADGTPRWIPQRGERGNVGPRRVQLPPSTAGVWPSVCRAGTARFNLAREENQGRTDQAGATQQPETIEKTQKSRLLLEHARELCAGV